jgi:hypothetical protein
MARNGHVALIIFITLGLYAYQFYWDVLFRQTVIIEGSVLSFQRRPDGAAHEIIYKYSSLFRFDPSLGE